ncbi:MAG: pyruvate dehydrogenase complex dihydrolipoamide acetyltransferase [Alphaproteobacteria bacterium]|nr:pyruvate dehydrogenase complex dihydrolipoamide acetyltransferase [Alphaproteobacteria bacterium]
MPTKILMPALSPTMTEGNLARWLKKEGDMVKAGDVIAEIETDKATMEVEAVDEGKLARIIIPAGSQGVKVNALIAVLLDEGENDNAVEAALKGAPAASPVSATVAPPPSITPQSTSPQVMIKDRVFASPLAKRLAKEKNINLSSVKGSGPHGRIIKADILGSAGSSMIATSPSAAPVAPKPQPTEGQKINEFGMIYTEIPNNNIKKITAKRLTESKSTVPHFYLTIDCRIDDLMTVREQLNSAGKDQYKLSVNDFVVKACAMALQAYPSANVSWTESAIRQYVHSDISVAVATPNGLMTPIVKMAEGKGLKTISSEIKDLAKRARDGKLKPEEFQGGTFTVSNLGMFGIKEFGAIINPPQSCILAVGAGEERVYAEKGQIKTGMFMTCTLSTDHRTVDGAVGAEFLQILKRYIENPATMLL